MGEIADDHYVNLSWREGVGVGGDCGNAPPCDHPAYGGMDAYIQRHTQRPANTYRCTFCRSLIVFLKRKPYNLVDGSPHRCLADAAEARRNAGHAAKVEAAHDAWCARCGSGNDVAGFAHLPGCAGVPPPTDAAD